jgi:hypothetical protein
MICDDTRSASAAPHRQELLGRSPSTSVHPKQAPEPTNVILARSSSAAPEVSTRKPELIARGFRKLRDTGGGQKPDTVRI